MIEREQCVPSSARVEPLERRTLLAAQPMGLQLDFGGGTTQHIGDVTITPAGTVLLTWKSVIFSGSGYSNDSYVRLYNRAGVAVTSSIAVSHEVYSGNNFIVGPR